MEKNYYEVARSLARVLEDLLSLSIQPNVCDEEEFQEYQKDGWDLINEHPELTEYSYN